MTRYLALIFTLLLASTALAESSKLPPPDIAALKVATQTVNEAYQSDLNAAKTPQDKSAVVNKLLQSAGEEKDAVARFAMLSKAREIAIDNRDFDNISAAIDQMDGAYQIDALKLKADAVKSISKTARNPEQSKLVATARDIVDKALVADRYEIARSMAEIALSSARAANDPDLQRDAADKLREVREAETAYAGIKSALVTLADKPNDPAANLAVGRFRCFIKGDWDGGLPMLALGSDVTLKDLAAKDVAGKELAGATGADAWVALGDGWWAVAEKEHVSIKTQVQKRACKWYSDAAPTLTGLTKNKVEARLKSLANVGPSGVVNLLKLADVARDSVAGQWELRNGALVSDGSKDAMFEFLYQPPVEYDYRIVFARIGGNDVMAPICWAMGHQFYLYLGTPHNEAGFDRLFNRNTGLHIEQNPTTHHLPAGIVNGRRYTCTIKVRKNEVQAYLDDKLITEWKTDYTDLNLFPNWHLRSTDTIGIASVKSPMIFYSVDVTEITGKGQMLKPESR